MTSDLPWIEKYRPESLGELMSHEEIVKTIQRFLDQGKLPHFLFYGPPGTGKTSTILAVAKQLFSPKEFSSMVLELNASDDRGIGKFLVIEKFSENTRFCLICNYLSKITPAIQSRCTRFRFPPVPKLHMFKRLGEIAENEKVQLTEDGKVAIHRFSSGDMRIAINLLQSASMSCSVVDEAGVYACTGYPNPSEMKRLLESCLNDSLTVAFRKISEIKLEKGIALQDIVSELSPLIMRLKFPDSIKVDLITMLSEVEYRMSYGASEKLQLGALCAAFADARERLEAMDN
nr:replication factor C subunit 5 [Hymenolepis microstoma]